METRRSPGRAGSLAAQVLALSVVTGVALHDAHAQSASAPAAPGGVLAPAGSAPEAPGGVLAQAGSASPSPGADRQSAAETSTIAPVVVTASRTEQQIVDAIPHTTILTERDIRQSQAVDILSLLRREAGFEFVQSGGVGTISGVFLRGAENRQTLILIDGQRIESATAGFPALDQIMLDQIERIEIVRGNVSSLYGSGAVGGVIQIFTKRGSGAPRGELQLMGGSRNTWKVAGSVRGEIEGTRFALTASGFRTDNFSALDTGQVVFANADDDPYRNQSVSAQVEHTFGSVDVGAKYFRSSGDVKYDNAFGTPTEQNSSDNVVTAASAFARAKLSDRWLATLTVGEGRDRNENFTNGTPDGLFVTRNQTVSLVNEFTLEPGHAITAGYEHLRQKVEASVEYEGTKRDVDSLWLGYLGRFGPHQFQLNARYDDYSDFGGATTWLAGYGYEITPAFKVTAMLSTAFAAPTFNYLYYPGFGNPNLDAEHSKSAEVGLQYAKSGVISRLVWFHTEYRDLIQGVAPTFLPQNVAEATVDGVEASLTGTLLGIEWRAAATWQDPVNDQTGQQLLRRSKRHGSLAAAKSFGDFRIGGEVIASGPRPDISATEFTRITLPGYAVVNLTARWQIAKAWWAGLRIDNLFDKDYTMVSGYDTPGRGAFVTVGWQP